MTSVNVGIVLTKLHNAMEHIKIRKETVYILSRICQKISDLDSLYEGVGK